MCNNTLSSDLEVQFIQYLVDTLGMHLGDQYGRQCVLESFSNWSFCKLVIEPG